MKLQITHETHYDYAPAVDIAQHMAYLQPLTTAQQQLLAHNLVITPEPAQNLQRWMCMATCGSFSLCKARISS